MLTFFTSCKPFKCEDAIAQRNAITSWTMLRPEPEIIIFGDDDGVKEFTDELGLRHIPDVNRSEFGNPIITDLFDKAQQVARYDVCCYINADIILLDDFARSVELATLRRSRFLLVGKRHDLDVTRSLTFDAGWEAEIRNRVASEGKLYHLAGMDYFVFRKGQWGKIPPFILGNIRWDNWMVYEARRERITTIDGTATITAIHQNHKISHAEELVGDGIESDDASIYNLKLYGMEMIAFYHLDASHILTSGGLKLALSWPYLERRLITLPVFYPASKFLCRLLLKLTSLVSHSK